MIGEKTLQDPIKSGMGS
jgi:hypothetical protein